jgi:hypothetical protein
MRQETVAIFRSLFWLPKWIMRTKTNEWVSAVKWYFLIFAFYFPRTESRNSSPWHVINFCNRSRKPTVTAQRYKTCSRRKVTAQFCISSR